MARKKPVARMTVERDSATVRLIFVFSDEYQAMKFFDELTKQTSEGEICLALNVGRQT